MGSFRQWLRDLPVIGYFLRVVYAVWKLPQMWDFLTGAGPDGRPRQDSIGARRESISAGTEWANAGSTQSVIDVTARVIDLTALVKEQAFELSQQQERLHRFAPVYVGRDRLLVRTET